MISFSHKRDLSRDKEETTSAGQGRVIPARNRFNSGVSYSGVFPRYFSVLGHLYYLRCAESQPLSGNQRPEHSCHQARGAD